MQRRGASGRPEKGQRAKKPPRARKASAAHSGHAQEQLVERLRRERDEAVELQAASAEVLKIISSSPGELKSVFEAMLASALRICKAKFGHILLYDGERYHAAHLHDVPPSYRAFWLANQVTEACGWEQAPRYLIRDRDGAYGAVFVRRLRSIGIRDRPTSPRSPWQNAGIPVLLGHPQQW
jgi:hypothetical protein